MTNYTMPVLSEQEREIDIAACIESLQVLEKNLKTWGPCWIDYIESQIRRQKIALAALTAQPVAWMLHDDELNHSVPTKAEYTLNFHRSKGWRVGSLYETPPVPIKQEGEC